MKIFLYFEETDLCKRVKESGEKIIEIKAEVSHLGKQPPNITIVLKLKCQAIGIDVV